MPLSRSQFEAGDADPSLAALDLLRNNADLAFSISEIMAALREEGMPVSRQRLRSGLARLEKRGRVESKKIGTTLYYQYRRLAMGFRRQRGT